MVKADLRNTLGAKGQGRPGPPADPASTGLVLRAFHEGADAHLLYLEIQRLYRQLQGHPSTDAPLEQAIHALAARHWLITRGITIGTRRTANSL